MFWLVIECVIALSRFQIYLKISYFDPNLLKFSYVLRLQVVSVLRAISTEVFSLAHRAARVSLSTHKRPARLTRRRYERCNEWATAVASLSCSIAAKFPVSGRMEGRS